MRAWTEITFPWMIRKLKPQVVLCLGWTLPLWRPISKYALLVADIGPVENLGFTMSSRDRANRNWLMRMPKHADLILTNAEFTKQRMHNLLGLDQEKIKVIRPIHPLWFANPRDSGSGHYPSSPFFLSIGNIEPRKNFPGLIAAYALLKKRRPEAPPLYILGHKAWGYQDALAAANHFGVSSSVMFTDYLSDADRNAYLAHCTVFISSSLYEGWGLPLFEALALERPAIYHAGSSQEEFAKGLALAVDCANPEVLAQAMETLWSVPVERERVQAGLRHALPKVLDYDLTGELTRAIKPMLPRVRD